MSCTVTVISLLHCLEQKQTLRGTKCYYLTITTAIKKPVITATMPGNWLVSRIVGVIFLGAK